MQRHDWQNLVHWNRLTEAINPAEYVARRNRYMRNRTLDHLHPPHLSMTSTGQATTWTKP